jgi:hypothetical protein
MNKINKIAKEIVYDYKNDTKVKNATDELLDAIKQTFTKVENCAFTDSVINVVANIKSVKYNSRETIIF